MAVYRKKIFAAAAKVEGVSGTDAVPALATDALRIVGVPTSTITTVESGDRGDVIHGGLGKLGRAKPIGRKVAIELTLELFGKGTAYASINDLVHADALLRGAGMAKSFNAGKVTYTTLDAGMETFTLYLWGADGRLYKATGCVAKPKLALAPGKPWLMTFACEGRLIADPAMQAIAGLVLPNILPPVWSETTVSVGAWSTTTAAPNQLAPRKLDVDFGLQTTDRPWAGATGLLGQAVTDRAMRASMDVEVVDASVFDPFAIAMQAQDAAATDTHIATSAPGGVGNTVDLVTGQWALEQPGAADLGGLAGWSLAGDLVARSIAAGPGAGREFALSFA
jgi:hypothetical protein